MAHLWLAYFGLMQYLANGLKRIICYLHNYDKLPSYIYSPLYTFICNTLHFLHSVTLQKILVVQPEPTHERSATAATIGGFVGGTVFGVLATLLVGGIVMGAVRIARKKADRR